MEDSLRPRIAAIIGLGNPGRDYAQTRHNLGFEVVERLAGNTPFTAGQGSYYICRADIASCEIALLKPTTYMNRSGLAVASFAESLGLTPSQILVIADDFNLPFGQIRLRQNGTDGGHKGLASIIYYLASSDFPRIRLGVGPVPEDNPAVDFVLDRFTNSERPTADEMIVKAAEAAVTWLKEGFDIAAAQYNRAIEEN
jgi:peptidyl-tRNA hydrolase, PTH1 family